jgi:hypothetical protein
MFTPEIQGKIADVARYMDAGMERRGTIDGHAQRAVRAILGLARFTAGDSASTGEMMAKVETIIGEYAAEAWRFAGCDEHAGMEPLFGMEEIPRVTRVA